MSFVVPGTNRSRRRQRRGRLTIEEQQRRRRERIERSRQQFLQRQEQQVSNIPDEALIDFSTTRELRIFRQTRTINTINRSTVSDDTKILVSNDSKSIRFRLLTNSNRTRDLGTLTFPPFISTNEFISRIDRLVPNSSTYGIQFENSFLFRSTIGINIITEIFNSTTDIITIIN